MSKSDEYFEVISQDKIIWEFYIFRSFISYNGIQTSREINAFLLFVQKTEPIAKIILMCQKGKDRKNSLPVLQLLALEKLFCSSSLWYIQKIGRSQSLSFCNLCCILIFRKWYSSNLRAQQFQQGQREFSPGLLCYPNLIKGQGLQKLVQLWFYNDTIRFCSIIKVPKSLCSFRLNICDKVN